MMRPITRGSTDQSVVIRIVDSTDGTPETGVVFNTAGIDLWYRREGATKTSITEATLATLDAAHSDGGILHIGDGYYRLDLPDAACSSSAGVNGVMVGGTVTGMVVIGCYAPLYAVDPYDTVRMGMTALPNAVVNATGGLFANVVNAGTAQAGSSTGMTLAAAAFGADDLANGLAVSIISGTGAKQTKQIVDFATSTQIATTYVAGPPVQGSAWVTTPDNTSVYVVHPFPITPTPVIATAGIVSVNATQFAGQTITAGAGVTIPSSIASPTNITAGTITTVTNLTNAATAGDLTATMKTSVTTAATAATPVAASVTAVVNANVTKVNSVTIDGVGTVGDPWGPA